MVFALENLASFFFLRGICICLFVAHGVADVKETATLAFALGCFFAGFAKVRSSLWLKVFWLRGLGHSYCVDGRREFFYENLGLGLEGGAGGCSGFLQVSFFSLSPLSSFSLTKQHKQLNLARIWL